MQEQELALGLLQFYHTAGSIASITQQVCEHEMHLFLFKVSPGLTCTVVTGVRW